MNTEEQLMQMAREAVLPYTVALYKGFTARESLQWRVRGGGCASILELPNGTQVYATCYHVWQALYDRWLASKTKVGMEKCGDGP